jgi:hypothetical protein
MMSDLADVAAKLDPLIRRLATDHDGERLATVAALGRVLAAGGSNFHELADCVVAGAQPSRVIVIERDVPYAASDLAMASALDGSPSLSEWENGFVANLLDRLRRHRRISSKQRAILTEIYRRAAP